MNELGEIYHCGIGQLPNKQDSLLWINELVNQIH